MVLILGAKGMLGGALQKVFPDALAWDREEADVTRIAELTEKISRLSVRPEAVINCVAYNDVDGAESKPDTAFLLNSEVPGGLARMCRELGMTLVHFSTNYVFDGQQGVYEEADQPHPLSVYARSKYEGELAVQHAGGAYYILRTAVLFGPKGQSELSKKSFVDIMLDLSLKTDTVRAVSDEINSITYVKDLAERVRFMLQSGLPSGIYHAVNAGQASWYDFAKEIFSVTGKAVSVAAVPASEFPRAAERPKKSVLASTKLPPLRPWQESLAEFLRGQH